MYALSDHFTIFIVDDWWQWHRWRRWHNPQTFFAENQIIARTQSIVRHDMTVRVIYLCEHRTALVRIRWQTNFCRCCQMLYLFNDYLWTFMLRRCREYGEWVNGETHLIRRWKATTDRKKNKKTFTTPLCGEKNLFSNSTTPFDALNEHIFPFILSISVSMARVCEGECGK